MEINHIGGADISTTDMMISEEQTNQPSTVDVAGAGRGVKRQYKKDTIYLYDLYTLTYDNNEQLESIEMFNTIENENVGKVVADF